MDESLTTIIRPFFIWQAFSGSLETGREKQPASGFWEFSGPTISGKNGPAEGNISSKFIGSPTVWENIPFSLNLCYPC
jgi:hypothetical protein